MRVLDLLRGVTIVVLIALPLTLGPSAYAGSGSISLTVYKGGWFIGASGGSGRLVFRGRTYRLGVGGINLLWASTRRLAQVLR